MKNDVFLAGSPYWVEHVLGMDMSERAKEGKLTHLLLNQPPICDSHCRRCFMPSERRNNCQGQMSLEEIRSILEQAAEAGMLCLEISGEGEPLLARSIREIIQTAFDNGFTTTLITNGHALTKELVQFLFARNVTLVVSLFSVQKELYELDNGLPDSHTRTLENIKMAAQIYREGDKMVNGRRVLRMAIHATVQADNISDLSNIEEFCSAQGIFFSIAPLAPVGGGSCHSELMATDDKLAETGTLGDNSIILSKTSCQDVGREVCGTCLYGLNIGFDGNVLFDAHAGYEIGDLLGNIRSNTVKELVAKQRKFAPKLFESIDGFCPVRDPKWPVFLQEFLANPSF